MQCEDAERELEAADIAADAVASQANAAGQGSELGALLGEGWLQQRPAWLRQRLPLAAAGAAALLLLGAGGARVLLPHGGGQSPVLDGKPVIEFVGLDEEESECSLHGGDYNCIESKCCKGPHMVCFEKNEDYATCRESCVVGVHHDDPKEHQTPWSCKPLYNKVHEPPSGPITLKSFHDKYVVADRFHGKWVKADRDVAEEWETFNVKSQDDHTIALKSHHKDYIACEPDGDLRADRAEVKDWERFIWVENDDSTYSLLCAHTGKYLKATPDGVLRAEAHIISDWEKFLVTSVEKSADTKGCSLHGDDHNCLETKCCKDPHRVCFEKNEDYATCFEGCVEGIHHDDPEKHQTPWSCKPLSPDANAAPPPIGSKIALKTAHEKYVAAHPNGHMEADREVRNDWETFTVRKGDNHKIALESHHGKYVACEPHQVVKADREKINSWEMFGWVVNADGTVALLCHTGKYWNVPPNGELKSESPFVGSWEQFQVEVLESPLSG